jgi:CHRD domain
MTHRYLRSLLVLALAVTPLFGQWHLEAVLSGANEVPPVPSAATGFGSFTLNRPANTITYHVQVTGVVGTAAHLHMAPAGSANPAIFIGLVGGPNVWEGTTAPLAAADVVTLLNEGLYVNVHSAAFPGGEIRGQLIPVRRTYFTALINGASETPPNASLATGFGRVRLNEPENKVIYDVVYTGLTALVAHIHVGAVGVAGPPLVTLLGGSGHYCGVSQTLTPAEVASLKANGMYVNIHTAAFPGGEIRGQLNQQVQPFSTIITGGEENPPTPSAATGKGRLDYNPVTNTISYSITTAPLPSGFLAAHIHRGVVGQNGSIMFALIGGPTVFVGTTTPLSTTQLADLFKGNLYVNFHSNAFSGGEIRGQIRPDPYIYGFGGDGTPGKPRFDAAGYNATTSNDVTLHLSNAHPGANVSLFLSGNNTFSTLLGAPLPISIPPVGTLWIDADPAVFLPMVADATGCASLTVSVPTDPALDFFRGYLQCVSHDPINGPMLILSDAAEFTIL